jgi:hypothetical protein
MTTAPDNDNPGWADGDFMRTRSFPEMLPELARKLKAQRGRPRLARLKVQFGIRLVADVGEGAKPDRQGLQCARCAGAAGGLVARESRHLSAGTGSRR